MHRGYSKKLRFLERTQKVTIGAFHEMIEDGVLACEYAETNTHRGDGFTKVLAPAKFVLARSMMNLRNPEALRSPSKA